MTNLTFFFLFFPPPALTDNHSALTIPKSKCYQLYESVHCYLYERDLENICEEKPKWQNYTIISRQFDENEDSYIIYRENIKDEICKGQVEKSNIYTDSI